MRKHANGIYNNGVQVTSDAELDWSVKQILVQFATESNSGDKTGDLNIDSIGTSVGSFEDTRRSAELLSHPYSGTTSNTVYTFKQNVATVSESSIIAPLTHGGASSPGDLSPQSNTEMDNSIFSLAFAKISNTTLSTAGTGTYYLGTSAPGTGTWIGQDQMIDSVTTHANDDDVRDIYKLWRRTDYGSPTEVRPLKQIDANLREMSDADMVKLTLRLRNRIVSTGIGKYVFQASAPGAGTWINRGTALNRLPDITSTQYGGNYSAQYTGSFARQFTRGFSAQFTRAQYSRGYTGTFQRNYAGQYGRTFFRAYSSQYARGVVGGNYTDGNYARTNPGPGYSAGQFTRARPGPQYAGSYARATGGSLYDGSAYASGSQYTGNYNGPSYAQNFYRVTTGPQYATNYGRTYAGQYARQFTRVSYARVYTANYGRQYHAQYARSTTGPSYTSVNYQRVYSAQYGRDFARSYTAQYARTYSAQYARSYTAQYARIVDGTQYSSEYLRVSIYTSSPGPYGEPDVYVRGIYQSPAQFSRGPHYARGMQYWRGLYNGPAPAPWGELPYFRGYTASGPTTSTPVYPIYHRTFTDSAQYTSQYAGFGPGFSRAYLRGTLYTRQTAGPQYARATPGPQYARATPGPQYARTTPGPNYSDGQYTRDNPGPQYTSQFTRQFTAQYDGTQFTRASYARTTPGPQYNAQYTVYYVRATGGPQYAGTQYTRQYAGTYLSPSYQRVFIRGQYERQFTRQFSRTYSGNYIRGQYTRVYAGQYTRQFNRTYSAQYARQFSRSYVGQYTVTYVRDVGYTTQYTRARAGPAYTSEYARAAYAGQFTGSFSGSQFTSSYTSQFAGSRTKLFAGDTVTTNYTSVTKTLWLRVA